MTVYEMIQELSQHEPDAEIHIQLEGPCTIEEYETDNEVIGTIDKVTKSIHGTYVRQGRIFFDVIPND